MQHTFQIKSSNLNSNFIKSVRTMFGDKELKIVVEDIDKKDPIDQRELYEEALSLIGLFEDVKVDPNLDLSKLANDVNL